MIPKFSIRFQKNSKKSKRLKNSQETASCGQLRTKKLMVTPLILLLLTNQRIRGAPLCLGTKKGSLKRQLVVSYAASCLKTISDGVTFNEYHSNGGPNHSNRGPKTNF